jgi:hypothetical protein
VRKPHDPKRVLAAKHAAACWHAMERHAGSCRLGCMANFDGSFTLGNCTVGKACADEYHIAVKAVLAMSPLETGDMESTLDQAMTEKHQWQPF